MKKHSLTALLLILFWGFGSFCYAQSVVRITQLGADYAAAPPTVSFRVYWDSAPDNIPHLDSVWLFVDYQPIAANGSLGAWTPATLTNPAATAPGTVIAGSLNGRGFYLRGATPTFSSTVTVALDGLSAGDRFNWCAYASDYPPNATEGAGFYELHGTPPFLINGTVTEPTRQYAGCITSLTDRTGCPGLVPASPAISSFIASPDTICVGESVTLEATATGAINYSFNGGQTWIPATASTTTIVFPTHDTAYTVHVANAAGCSATAGPLPVTVYPLPIATFNNPPTTACAGSTVNLTVGDGSGSYCFSQHCSACVHNPYASGNDDPTEYDCLFGSATCTFEVSNSYAVTMPDSGNITVCVRVVNEHGCLDSACVTIAVTPVPAAPVLSGDATQCASSAALSCFGETGYTYQLQNDLTQAVGVPLSGAGAPLNFPITASGAYTVVATDATTSCVVRSNTQAVTVNDLPATPTDASSNTRCEAGTVTFSATAPADCTIDWYDASTGGNIVTDGDGVNSFSPTINASTTYYAQARDNATGCVSDTRLPVTGTVDTKPVITNQPANADVCVGGTVTLSVVAPGATAYQWKDIDGNDVTTGSGGTTANYTTGALTANTAFWVEVSSGACTVKSDEAVVTVNLTPAAPTDASANTRCGAGTVAFSATPPADCAGCTIDWYTDDTGGTTVTGGYRT
ncbi:MAG: hypothetical protein LBF19_00775, partial [Prevotellaceae bacterium]|nr:hypothetical protein [Prevotellaceae bacterium]